MALNLQNDNTLLYLLQKDMRKVYRKLEVDTEAGKTGLATKISVDEAMNRAAELREQLIEAARQQAADKEELQEAIDNVEGTTLLHIDSSRGTVFKHSAVSTILRVVLYRGGERITNATEMRAAFGAGAYLQWSWQRMGDETYGTISASDSRLSDEGFTFTLTPADVDTKVTFACQLIVG